MLNWIWAAFFFVAFAAAIVQAAFLGRPDVFRDVVAETGFFADEAVSVDGVPVVPRKLTEALLFHAWKRPEGEEELTFLRVICEGRRGGVRVRRTFELLDRTNPKTGDSSMARTTGFPCTTAARLLLEGAFTTPGIFPSDASSRKQIRHSWNFRI